MFDLRKLETMSESEERTFWASCVKVIRRDDGEAAKSHLREGRPIYYCDDRICDVVIREWPDGRKELVEVSEEGTIVSVGNISKNA